MEDKITKEFLINKLDERLLGWPYKNILEINNNTDAKLACFILGACFIDVMAGFYFGIDCESSKKDSGKRFKEFVKIYLTKYDSETLWSDLRCGLVHAYAAGYKYLFVHNKPSYHLYETDKKQIVINLDDFIDDVKHAYDRLIEDIRNDDKIFKNARKRYFEMGLMEPKQLDTRSHQVI